MARLAGRRPNRIALTESVPLAAAAFVADELVRTWWSSEVQGRRMSALIGRVVAFAEASGCRTLDSFDGQLARAFVDAVDADGQMPSLELRHRRRCAIRLLFRAARARDLSDGDPTLDLVLPRRSPLHTRPLTDEEMVLCRASASWSLTATRRAAAMALAETTARTGEAGLIRASDLDLDASRVWLPGGGTTAPRWGEVSEWGAAQLRRRLDALGHADVPLLYRGNGTRDVGQVSSCIALTDVLRRAGLADEPDVRPASIVAWAGRRILEETGRIDEVARRLGMRSLDRTARFIDWSWSEVDT